MYIQYCTLTVLINLMRPCEHIKGYAFATSAAAASTLAAIINGLWTNKGPDPSCLVKVGQMTRSRALLLQY